MPYRSPSFYVGELLSFIAGTEPCFDSFRRLPNTESDFVFEGSVTFGIYMAYKQVKESIIIRLIKLPKLDFGEVNMSFLSSLSIHSL